MESVCRALINFFTGIVNDTQKMFIGHPLIYGKLLKYKWILNKEFIPVLLSF